MGRPSTFRQEIADEICQRLSRGETLVSICSDAHMPASRTVSDWTAANPSFSADFARAREIGFDAIANECLRIADAGENDPQRDKLRVETRLKLLAKWDPKRYGDKLDVNAKTDGVFTFKWQDA